MSYVVSTDTVEFYRGRQNHSGRIAVSVRGVTTRITLEDTHIQREPLLGSRTTARTGHRRISGRNQHHLPPRPHSTLDQFPLRGTDRGIRRLPGHRRTGQERGFEILHRDHVMISDHSPSPHTRRMRVLASRLLMDSRGLTACTLVSSARGLPTCTASPCHLPLRASQFDRTPFTMPAVGQVVGGVGGGRRGRHPPVDTDATGRGGNHSGEFAAHHKRRVPVAERVPAHTHRGGFTGQFPRPHDRNDDLAGQAQAAVLDRESACRVFQRRQRLLAGLDDRAAATFHLERMVERLGVGTQRLLLRDLGTRTQPRVPCSCSGEHLRQFPESRLLPGLLLVDGFIPQETATMPFGFERTRRRSARAQAIGVTHDLIHSTIVSHCPTTIYVKESTMSTTRRTPEPHSDSSPRLNAGISSELPR